MNSKGHSLFFYFTLFFFCSMGEAKSSEQVFLQSCKELGGRVVPKFQCPKTKIKLPWRFCLTKDRAGRPLFFDGCTGPTGGHLELFFPHCIKHDFCYHHEPITRGKDQKACDRELQEGLLDSCLNAKAPKACRFWANSMYRAVRGFGALAYHCANYEADYEEVYISDI